jgi:HEAT repeat protein
MKNDPIESSLARLDDIPSHTPEGKAAFRKALTAKSNLIVAKAARLIAAAMSTELSDELAAAFDRMIAKGTSVDKACAAMIAIARSLVAMDYDGPNLFLSGVRHVQMEGSYGPLIDTAAELREVCAMGLANSAYPHKLRELVLLMVDKEWRVRAGAIRAIAVVGTDSASLLLRYKMLIGDKDAEVMSDCFASVLLLEGSEGVKLVAEFTKSANPEIREAAILAIGASRRSDAIDWLTARFAQTADPAGRKCILLALSTSRTETALEFLLKQIRDGTDATARLAADALAIHIRDHHLADQIDAAWTVRSTAAGNSLK